MIKATETKNNISDWAVNINVWKISCACRCRHCSVNGGKSSVEMRYERAKQVAERFIEWSKESSVKPPAVDFSLGYSYEMPRKTLLDYIQFRRKYQMVGWDYLPLNGLRKRNSKEIGAYLETLQEAGIKVVNLTFFGLRGGHDAWAGRRGDFQFVLRLAEALPRFGLKRSEAVFLHKGNSGDIPDLLQTLNGIPGLIRRDLGPWDYMGRGRELEEERLDLQTLGLLPADIRNQVDDKYYRTEASWIEAIRKREIPEKSRRVYFVQIRDDTIEYLEKTDCRKVLDDLLQEEYRYQSSEFTLARLADRVGDENNMKIYSLRDLEWKWLELFCLLIGKKVPPHIIDPSCSHTRLRA